MHSVKREFCGGNPTVIFDYRMNTAKFFKVRNVHHKGVDANDVRDTCESRSHCRRIDTCYFTTDLLKMIVAKSSEVDCMRHAT